MHRLARGKGIFLNPNSAFSQLPGRGRRLRPAPLPWPPRCTAVVRGPMGVLGRPFCPPRNPDAHPRPPEEAQGLEGTGLPAESSGAKGDEVRPPAGRPRRRVPLSPTDAARPLASCHCDGGGRGHRSLPHSATVPVAAPAVTAKMATDLGTQGQSHMHCGTLRNNPEHSMGNPPPKPTRAL